MAIYHHMKKFASLPVRQWGGGIDWSGPTDEKAGADGGERPKPKLPALRNPEKALYRIGVESDESENGMAWEDKFRHFLDQKNVERVVGIVVGAWSPDDSGVSSDAVIKALTKAARKLPNLRAIFLGDLTAEECEISWIRQGDVGRLLKAYPSLEHLGVRGGEKLKFDVDRHTKLRTLVIETGGLSRKVVHGVLAADLPELEHLELWLGTEGYGADTTAEDFAPLLAGTKFPNLKYLGLRDSEIADDLAAVLANAPVLKKLKTLDLSLGTLGDDGAKALLSSKGVKKLKELDLHYHFCSPEVVKQLKKLGPQVDASKPQKAQDWGGGERMRFVAVSE